MRYKDHYHDQWRISTQLLGAKAFCKAGDLFPFFGNQLVETEIFAQFNIQSNTDTFFFFTIAATVIPFGGTALYPSPKYTTDHNSLICNVIIETTRHG